MHSDELAAIWPTPAHNIKTYRQDNQLGTRLDGPMDFVSGWLRQVLGFLGLKDLRFVAADGLMFGGEERLAEARATIQSFDEVRAA